MRGLRARSAVAFVAMALVLSIVLSTATYQLVRWYLLDKREALATRQVTLNALVVKGQLAGGEIRPSDVLDTLRSTTNARAVLRVDGIWYAVVVQLSETAVPTSLLSVVATNGAGHQRAVVNGEPYLIYGITIPGRNAQYYEFVSAEEYARTMSVLARVLLAAASVTTLGGAAAGWLTLVDSFARWVSSVRRREPSVQVTCRIVWTTVTIRTCTRSHHRSTKWRRHSRNGSNASDDSRLMSATSCEPHSPRWGQRSVWPGAATSPSGACSRWMFSSSNCKDSGG